MKALGVFARAPVPGHCKTRLAAALGPEAAARLYEAMLRDCLERFATIDARRHVLFAAPEQDGVTHLATIATSPWELVAQRGAELGARLEHAFAELGGDAMILGSDAPHLPLAPLRRLAVEDDDGITIGPTDDGGYYLIAMTRVVVDVLREMPWSTPGLLDATRQRCRDLDLPLYELPPAYDLDTAADVDRARRDLGRAPDLAPRTYRALFDLDSATRSG